MTYVYRWRKAMVISACLHIFLFIMAGHLMAGLTAPLPMPEEVMLEMDLVSETTERPGNSTTAPEPTPLPTPVKSVSAEVTPVMPVPIETRVQEPESVVTTSELAMTAADVPVTASLPNQSASSSSANTASSSAPVTGGGSPSGVAAPSILAKVDPVYPSAARQAGLEGTVVLKIQILPNGRPGDIAVVRSTGHAVLDAAAVAAVGKWQFVPAKDRASGRTVACTTTLPVSFRLHDQKKG